MICNEVTVDGDFTKEEQIKYDHIEKSYSEYLKNPLVRFLMTGEGQGGSRSHSEWSSWAETMINSSLKDLTLADAEAIHMETKKITNGLKRHSFTNVSSMKEWLIKTATLPADLYNWHGMGRVHEVISAASADREFRVNRLDGKIKALSNSMNVLSEVNMERGQRIINESQEAIEMANANFAKVIKKRDAGYKLVPSELSDAQVAKDQAHQQRKLVTLSKDADPSAKAMRLVAEHLNGETTTKELLAKLGPIADSTAIKTIVSNARSMMDEFKSILETANVDMYEMTKAELEPMYGEIEAAEIAAKLTHFKAEESYYPNKNLMTMMSRVNNIIETRSMIRGADAKNTIRKFSDEARTAHTIQRKGGGGEIDVNILSVLSAYGREIYDHSFAARVGNESMQFANEIMKLDNVMGQPDNSPAVMYANSARKLIVGHMEQMFDNKMSTATDEALGVITSFQVLTKLTSPSTMLTNRVEGIAQYISHIGVQNYGKAKELYGIYKDVINEASAEAGITFNSTTGFDKTQSMASNKRVSEILTKEELADMGIEGSSIAAENFSTVRKGLSKMSGFVLDKVTYWTAAENANRKEAFNLSAAEAAHYVVNKWEGKFMNGEHTDFLVKNFKLNKSLAEKAKGGDKEARAELWSEFRNKYIMRHGYRGMFQTQFQYSESARNWMDLDAKTSWITMFQHYPRSLASAVIWSMNDVKTLYEVGGPQALFRTTTSRKMGRTKGDGLTDKLFGNIEVNHKLQHVASLGALSVLKQSILAMTGVQISNALAHPLGAVLGDLIEYFRDDEPVTKREKAWDLLYGYKQPIRGVIGPAASEALDMTSWMAQQLGLVTLNTVQHGLNNGDMGGYLAKTLGVLGFKPGEEALTHQGRRQYTTALDIVREHTLNSFAVKNRSVALVSSIIKQQPHQTMENGAKLLGVRVDHDANRSLREKRKIRLAEEKKKGIKPKVRDTEFDF